MSSEFLDARGKNKNRNDSTGASWRPEQPWTLAKLPRQRWAVCVALLPARSHFKAAMPGSRNVAVAAIAAAAIGRCVCVCVCVCLVRQLARAAAAGRRKRVKWRASASTPWPESLRTCDTCCAPDSHSLWRSSTCSVFRLLVRAQSDDPIAF